MQIIGAELARDAGLPLARPNWVLEGGAIDTDGSGTVDGAEFLMHFFRLGNLEQKHMARRAQEEAEKASVEAMAHSIGRV